MAVGSTPLSDFPEPMQPQDKRTNILLTLRRHLRLPPHQRMQHVSHWEAAPVLVSMYDGIGPQAANQDFLSVDSHIYHKHNLGRPLPTKLDQKVMPRSTGL